MAFAKKYNMNTAQRQMKQSSNYEIISSVIGLLIGSSIVSPTGDFLTYGFLLGAGVLIFVIMLLIGKALKVKVSSLGARIIYSLIIVTLSYSLVFLSCVVLGTF